MCQDVARTNRLITVGSADSTIGGATFVENDEPSSHERTVVAFEKKKGKQCFATKGALLWQRGPGLVVDIIGAGVTVTRTSPADLQFARRAPFFVTYQHGKLVLQTAPSSAWTTYGFTSKFFVHDCTGRTSGLSRISVNHERECDTAPLLDVVVNVAAISPASFDVGLRGATRLCLHGGQATPATLRADVADIAQLWVSNMKVALLDASVRSDGTIRCSEGTAVEVRALVEDAARLDLPIVLESSSIRTLGPDTVVNAAKAPPTGKTLLIPQLSCRE